MLECLWDSGATYVKKQSVPCREQTFGHRAAEWKRGGMNWETVCTLLCVKQIASGNVLYIRGAQLSALW